MPSLPNSLKFTAHGYINITSTSNSTKSIATRKYFMEIGVRALPTTSMFRFKWCQFVFGYPFRANFMGYKHRGNHKTHGHQHLKYDGQTIN